MIVTNKMDECVFSIPSPFDEDAPIDLYITLDNDTKNEIEFVNGAPCIKAKVSLNARILSANKNSDYFEKDNLELINNYAASYVKAELEKYLYKTSKDFKADIDLFGRHAVRYFYTWDDWVEYDWLDNYANAFFDVETNVNVVSSYLIS